MVNSCVLNSGLLDAFSRILKAFFNSFVEMKMKKYIALVGLLSMMQACTDPDTLAPIVEVTSLSPAPTTGLVCGETENTVVFLESGDTLQLTFTLSDDNELSQYKIDLHSNFDCHGHANKVETTDWFLISIEDVSGSSQTAIRELPVPADVTTGLYHFSIQATDVSGNNSITSVYSLDVTNTTDTESPTLSVSSPATSSFSVQKGSDLNFAGTLTDNRQLGEGGNGRLEVRYWSTTNQTVNDLYVQELDASVLETYNFDFNATVPITTVSGNYIFELRAFDGVNNPSNIFEYNVEVL